MKDNHPWKKHGCPHKHFEKKVSDHNNIGEYFIIQYFMVNIRDNSPSSNY